MLPQLDPTWYASQSLWMLITFSAMFLIVWRYVIPAMRATVDKRRSLIEEDIKKTEEYKAEATRLLKEIEASQSSIKEQTQAIFARAQEEAGQLTRQMEVAFDARLTARISEQEAALRSAKEKTMGEIATISTELTEAIIGKVAGIKVSAEEIKQETATVLGK